MIQQDNITLMVNSFALIGTYLISAFGAVLIFIGLYNIWVGDMEGLIMFIPGVVVLTIGLIFNKLLKKWVV